MRPPIAIDAAVSAALKAGAYVVYNLSGGKDSGAISEATDVYLDGVGHPKDRRFSVHADLGRAEWKSTPQVVEATAQRLGHPLDVVRRKSGDMVDRWETRFANGKRRYANLETYNLIGPWSSASLRFCTSELKAQVIGPHLAQKLRGETIIQVVCIRREESSNRAKTQISKPDTRFAKPGNRAGTEMMLWHPGVDWTKEEVFSCHTSHNIPLHEAYTRYGSSRLSCAFCIMASIKDMQAAASAAGNVELYLHLVAMEANSTFSFQPDRWLADIAPSLHSPGLQADLIVGRRRAAERQAIEAAMPPELRYVKGWPPRGPSWHEAQAISTARALILGHHGMENIYPTPGHIRERFDELIALKQHKGATS